MYPFYLILAYILFRLLLCICYPLLVLLHELAHAIPAYLFGKKEIKLCIGSGKLIINKKLCGHQINIGSKQLHIGYTSYSDTENKLFHSLIIAGFAPLLSLCLSLWGIYLFQTLKLAPVYWFFIAATWLANTHITINALWPFKNKAPDSPYSDLSYIIQLLKSK